MKSELNLEIRIEFANYFLIIELFERLTALRIEISLSDMQRQDVLEQQMINFPRHPRLPPLRLQPFRPQKIQSKNIFDIPLQREEQDVDNKQILNIRQQWRINRFLLVKMVLGINGVDVVKNRAVMVLGEKENQKEMNN